MKTVSVVLTIHNKEKLAYRVMKAIVQNSSPAVKEFIVVLDGCTDNSFGEMVRAVHETECEDRMALIYTPDVYELRANNSGMSVSTCDYSCLVQDDMEIQQKDFDVHLMAPFLKWPEVFAVTGRSAHNIVLNGEDNVAYTGLMGWDNKPDRNTFYIRDVVNRGPLMLENKRTRELGMFDEYFLPQNQEDHNLCFAAYARGWLCGSRWVDYHSPVEWGTSRGKGAAVINAAMAANVKKIIERWHCYLTDPKHNEDRKIL